MDVCSACLLGINCRYNGKPAPEEAAIKLFLEGRVIPVCPEALGGMKSPHAPCEIAGGSGEDVLAGRAAVLDAGGGDWTKEFIKGAKQALMICKKLGVQKAYLKSKSPSCGLGRIYDGSFTGTLKNGEGVTAALLRKNGIEVIETG
ncbi:MAG: DUF523 domain-containing protein [Bacillota bacterium]|nr:DUF523 domain-containing protein [Bacillota bacterium]